MDSTNIKPDDRQVGGSHYKGTTYQHWDLAARANLGYFEGVITKYLVRYEKKAGLQDLDKADHYTEKLIELANDGRRCAADQRAKHDVADFCKANGIPERQDLWFALHLLVGWRSAADLEGVRMYIAGMRAALEARSQGEAK